MADETPTIPTEPVRLIDLDAAAAARAEERGDPPVVRWKGKTYQLPPECPARFLEAIVVDDFERAFDALFEDSDLSAAAFLDAAGYEDLVTLSQGIAEVYGLEGGLGNLRASGASSSNTSKR
jgi:hypothetical protein